MDRLTDLLERRLGPALAVRGFEREETGAVVAYADGVEWLLEVDVAPWSDVAHLCFALEWAVHVPGLEDQFGDPDECPVRGAVVDAFGSRWFELRTRRLAAVAAASDAVLAQRLLRAFDATAMPALQQLDTPAAVQAHLHEGLVTGRGVPQQDELRTIRRIAALSLLLGDRENAARWLDHLEARSRAAMAPDVVAERLAPLRQRLAS